MGALMFGVSKNASMNFGKQPRPEGHVRVVSDDFRKRLVLKIEMDGITARDIAAALKDHGYRTNESTISNLRRGRYPTSRLVEPLCLLYGWPLPPLPGESAEVSALSSKLLYLSKNNKINYEKISKIIDKAFGAQTSVDDDDDDHTKNR